MVTDTEIEDIYGWWKMLGTFNSLKNWADSVEGHYTLSDADVSAVQRVLIMMMDDIHSFCQRENLRYVITGGCAIGAVRHRGFIPWDDDIDVCMPRADYDRFAVLVKEAFADKYDVMEVRADKGYDLNFMKLRLKGTVFMEAADTDAERAGIFIDIFPIENVYDNTLAQIWQGIKSDGLQFVCSCVRIRNKKERLKVIIDKGGDVARTLKIKAALGTVFGIISFRKWLLITEKALSCCHNDESELVAIPVGRGHFRGERYPRNWFFEPVKRRFEDREYFFPARIKLYLRRLYGNDYMKIPPESEREHHSILRFDLGKYKNIQK